MWAAKEGTEGWGAARKETGGWGAAREGTGQQGTGQGHWRDGGGGQTHYHPYLFPDLVAIQTLNLFVTLNGMISTAM